MFKCPVHRRALVISTVFLLLLWGTSQAATFIVSPEHDNKRIQDVLDRARDGDRIIVKSGNYTESVTVSKKVLLIGLDSGGGKPVVNCGGIGSAITIFADEVLLEGFEVTNSGRQWKDAGIKINSKNNVVKDNDVKNNEYGIVLDGFGNNEIADNSICENDVGIALYSSENCTISGNTACNNTFGGILLSKSKNNSIRGNNASFNDWAGIILGESNENVIANNIARFNENEGIWLLRSSGNTIRGNRARYNYIFGIRLHYSNRNVISNNRARDNLDGISLENSNGNVLGSNYVDGNYYGIYVDNSFNNRIFMNDFVENVENAYTWNSTNFWNYTEKLSYDYNSVTYSRFVGNFWSGYTGPDPFGDGLIDTPLEILGTERDFHPLKKKSEKYTLRT